MIDAASKLSVTTSFSMQLVYSTHRFSALPQTSLFDFTTGTRSHGCRILTFGDGTFPRAVARAVVHGYGTRGMDPATVR